MKTEWDIPTCTSNFLFFSFQLIFKGDIVHISIECDIVTWHITWPIISTGSPGEVIMATTVQTGRW